MTQKKLTVEQRNELRPLIEKEAISFAVASVDNDEIDIINILKASFKAMHLAIAQLKSQPQMLLIDGNRFTAYQTIPHQCIIQGDGEYASIAAASVLAKTYRDEYMRQLHDEFPVYHWKK
jgi:ribonuclease HII